MSWNSQKQKVLGQIRVRWGSHEGENKRVTDAREVKACIMEAVNYIQHGVVGDDPPCVSGVIRDLMIQRNDSFESGEEGDKQRAALKRLVPEIIHTAPTIKSKRHSGPPVVTRRTKGYLKAEQQRTKIVRALEDKFEAADPGRYGRRNLITRISDGEVDTRTFNKLIRELAAVRKWG